jgi:chaperonin GroES
MIEFETTLKLEDVISHRNVAELLSETDRVKLGLDITHNFEADLLSRGPWEKKMETAMKLALQVVEAKSFPWPNASNVKFPLITIAALQYHARSYPVLIGSDTPVRCRVWGDDPDGTKGKRAERVENHMSYQVMEQDEPWEAETDKVLITQPIIGCAFKKTYYDPIREHNVSENILAKDLVVNYWTKSLDTAPRITQILFYTKNDVYERVVRDLWLPLTDRAPDTPQQTNLAHAQDKAQGMQMPETVDTSTPYEILEHHCWIDFDKDGYAEPYIVYVRRDTKQVLRVVARFFRDSIKKNGPGKILNIKAETYFTKYPFIPSPDGGFYDLGFGVLLGPLNESINTLINQLIDAGTMANTAGGFLSRGIKIRGGNYNFAPLEWKPVDTTGDDLRKGIMPLPVREPSQVLFTLLSLLINYGERIGGAVDILVGENPGQNTPAETSRNMTEQGMKIFNGIFKRTYRSLRDEFRKLYRLNQLYLDDRVEYVSDAIGDGIILWSDYQNDSSDVRPSADPHVVSDSQRLLQAHTLAERSAMTPGYNRYEVEKVLLKAIKISDIDVIYPDPKGPNAVPPIPNPKVQVEQIKAQAKQASDELKFKLGLLTMMQKAEEAQATVQKLEAETLVLMKEAEGADKQHRLNEINTMIGLAKERREGVLGSIKIMTDVYEAFKPEGKDIKVPGERQQPIEP